MQIKMMAFSSNNKLMHNSMKAMNIKQSIDQNSTTRKPVLEHITTAKLQKAAKNTKEITNTALDSSMVLALISSLIEDSVMVLMNALN